MTAPLVDVLSDYSVRDFANEIGNTVITPISTGLPLWDNACDETGGAGLSDWWYLVIGGASSSGKTNLALHLMRETALAGHRPGLISLETPQKGIQRRLYAHVSTLNYFDFLPHRFKEHQAEKTARLTGDLEGFRERGDQLDEAQVFVMQHPKKPTLQQIMLDVKRMHEHGSRLIIVDHLQLVKSPVADIHKAAAEVSEALREYAHASGVTIVGLSQLNREASRERDRRPTMHDLWGGTSMESNCNQVMLIDHSRQAYDEERRHLLRTYLYLDKNREGPSRILIPVEVNFKTGVWREAQPDEVGLWPKA